LSGDATNATGDVKVFTLEQEYRKEPTNESAANSNQEEIVASKSWKQFRSNRFSMRVLLERENMECVLLGKSNGYWCRVVFPQDAEPSIDMEESMIKSPVLKPSSKEQMEDSMNQSLASKLSFNPSSKVERMEDSMNRSLVSKPSSKVERVIFVPDFNPSIDMSKDTIQILKPSAKVENLSHHSGQWPVDFHEMRYHTQVSVPEETVASCRKNQSESTVDRKRKNPSAATANQRKIVKVKNEEASDLLEPTRNASSNASQRSSNASSKTWFWTKKEKQTLMKLVRTGCESWKNVAESVSKVGRGRSATSVRIIFSMRFQVLHVHYPI
jgi:hypothetical protein